MMLLWTTLALAQTPSAPEPTPAAPRPTADPGDVDALIDLATHLSWKPDERDAAIRAWRQALTLAPEDHRALLGLARTLAWAGQNEEAADRFDALITVNANDVEALLGRSQLARWTGDQATARALLERAEALAPESPRILAERARLEIDSTRYGKARAAANAALTRAPDLYEGQEARTALRAATTPQATAHLTWSQESTDFTRLGVTLPIDHHVLPDTRLRITPAYDRFLGPDTVDRLSIGAELHQTGLPQGLYVDGRYHFHALLDVGQTHEAALELGTVHPLDLPLHIGLGVRQRALVDLPTPEDPIAALNVVGSGGAAWAGLTEGVSVREAYASVATAPLPGLYLYGDGAYGVVDGGNTRRTVSAGIGDDVLQLLATPTHHALTVRYELYWLSLAQPDDRTFSPASFLAHTPGLEWRWSPGRVTLGVEGGVPLRADASVGWLAGAFGAVDLGPHLRVAARFRTMDDTAWQATGTTLALTGRW